MVHCSLYTISIQDTVKPELTTTSKKRPPVNNDQFLGSQGWSVYTSWTVCTLYTPRANRSKAISMSPSLNSKVSCDSFPVPQRTDLARKILSFAKRRNFVHTHIQVRTYKYAQRRQVSLNNRWYTSETDLTWKSSFRMAIASRWIKLKVHFSNSLLFLLLANACWRHRNIGIKHNNRIWVIFFLLSISRPTQEKTRKEGMSVLLSRKQSTMLLLQILSGLSVCSALSC